MTLETVLCANCGEPFKVIVGNGIKRSRRCPKCRVKEAMRKLNAKRENRTDGRKRDGNYGKLPKEWKQRPRPNKCEVCGRSGGTVLDHIVPRRLAIQHGDPDVAVNTIALGKRCSCHGSKGILERAMLKGDWFTVTQEFLRLQWPRERTVAAFKHFKFDFALEKFWPKV